MHQYIQGNVSLIVNGFLKVGSQEAIHSTNEGVAAIDSTNEDINSTYNVVIHINSPDDILLFLSDAQ